MEQSLLELGLLSALTRTAVLPLPAASLQSATVVSARHGGTVCSDLSKEDGDVSYYRYFCRAGQAYRYCCRHSLHFPR